MDVNHTLALHSSTDIKCVTISNHPSLSQGRVLIAEVPGFDEEHKRDAEKLKEVAEWLQSTYVNFLVHTARSVIQSCRQVDREHGPCRRHLSSRHLRDPLQHGGSLRAHDTTRIVWTEQSKTRSIRACYDQVGKNSSRRSRREGKRAHRKAMECTSQSGVSDFPI